jgi:hypothetical protein
MTGTAALTLLVGITKRWEKLDAGQPSTAQGEARDGRGFAAPWARRRLRRTAGGDASHAHDCVAAVETPGKKPVHELCCPQLARLIQP